MPTDHTTNGGPVLEVSGLRLSTEDGTELVKGVSFTVHHGQTLGIVGESGSGKSLTCRAILGILPDGLAVTSGSIRFGRHELTAFEPKDWRPLRGSRISAVFQDPASYLNPSLTVGNQLSEALRATLGMSRKAAKTRGLELLRHLGLHDADAVYRQYPFELSGGMLQRVLIAIAVSASPELLIADEATTALDVTVQAEVLDLLEDLQTELGLALVLVSHDLAVVAQACDHIIVMRDGHIVEAGPTAQVLTQPSHPYTRLLVENHHRFGIERFLTKEESLA
ncbi:ABC transporter ATP-binding protein [Paenarthrobacter sp. NPDC056912]|uniref:ABC transporter ATP-binding protein n=1 Tax=Paenarthrobacter sp. NPDC056912 TaxID=3345965 RepID=UPI003670DAAF